MTLAKVRAAVWRKFGDDYMCSTGVHDKKRAKERMFKDIYSGKGDPGGWAPRALAVIHCENGLDTGHYDTRVSEAWFELQDETGLLFEPVNAAVIAVYK